MSKVLIACRMTWLILALLLTTACRPDDLWIEQIAIPPAAELRFDADWQRRCYYAAWPVALPADESAPSPFFPPEWRLRLDDPAFQAYVEALLLALCAPTQPYRATMTIWVDSAPRAMTYVIEVESAQHYSVEAPSGPTCMHEGGQAYMIADGQWQEMKSLDTMACDNPLQALFLPLLPRGPQMPTRQGRFVAAQQETTVRGRMHIYTLEFTTVSYPITETITEPAERIVYQVWVDAEAGRPTRIVNTMQAGAIAPFVIELDYEITPFLSLPARPTTSEQSE